MKGTAGKAAPSRPCFTFVPTMEIRALTQFGRERLAARPLVMTRAALSRASRGAADSEARAPGIDFSRASRVIIEVPAFCSPLCNLDV